MTHNDLTELVDGFAKVADAEFSLFDLTRYIGEKGVEASEDEIADFAAVSDYLLEFDTLNETFVPRRTFFKGAQFRITPLDSEIEGGYLVPGHRFMPFLSHEVFPGSVQLALPDGSTVPVRKTSLPQAQAMAFLHFYGSSAAMEYLLFDDEANMAKLMPPFEADVSMRVFDLKRFYADSGFRPGDSLMLTVDDWLLGQYSVARADDASDAAAANKWVASMDCALNDALDEFGVDGDCNSQLALAMRNAHNDPGCVSLMAEPPLSIAAYFNLQKTLAVKMVGETALFWEADEEPMEEAMWDALENPPEPESELDAHFQALGLSLSDGEAEAYMRDALFRSDGNANTVLARVTEGRALFFGSAEEQDRFHELWHGLWDDVAKRYSRQEDKAGEVRSRFLALNDKAIAAVRQLDADGMGSEIFSNHAFMEFNNLTSMVSAALTLFNAPGDGVEVPPEFMGSGLLDQMDGALEALAQQMLKGGRERGGDGRIYQLKVALKGSKPPIWRRILIPADMELIDLHDAIQAAMGWDDAHLHQFKQGRTFYLPDPEDGFMGFGGFDTEDSTGVRVGDLLHKEKDKIVYEYDFGDSWEHTVTLEKILDPEEGLAYPVCIKGKRACPPEDCGGIWGYYNLLEILDDPKCDEHQGMLDWVGDDIDPEAFDLDAANARMKHYF